MRSTGPPISHRLGLPICTGVALAYSSRVRGIFHSPGRGGKGQQRTKDTTKAGNDIGT